MTHKKFSYLLSFLILFAFAGCSDDDNDVPDPDPDPDPASFSITYSGDLDAEIEGNAFFSEVTDQDTGEDYFVIYLHSEEMDGTSITFGKKGFQPGEGSFPISTIEIDGQDVALPENEFLAWGNMHYNEFPMYVYYSVSGTLNLEQSDENSVIATFEFSAAGYSTDDPGTELDIEISGSLHAIQGDVPDPDPDPDPGDPDFTATLSGDINTVLEGRALFAEVTDDDTGETGFFINLSDHGENLDQIYFGKQGDRPGAGDFSIADIDIETFSGIEDLPADAFMGLIIVETDEGLAYLASDGGSITLDASTPDAVSGTFDFSATGFAVYAPMIPITVEVTGSFEARGGEFDIPDL